MNAFNSLAKFFCLAALIDIASAAVAAPEFTEQSKQFVSHLYEELLLENVRLVDGTGAPAVDNQCIRVEAGKIVAVGPSGSCNAPPTTQRLDLAGRTVLPGFVMLHEHMFYNANDPDWFIQSTQPVVFPRLYLAGGVTTARTAGSFEPYTDLKVKQYIASGRLVGPDFDTTAPFIEGYPAQFLQAHELQTAEQAITYVNYWADQGMTSFKAYMNVKRSVLKASIDAAHARGLKVAGHLCSVTYEEASDMGIDNLEHGFLIATDFVENRKPDTCGGFPLERFVEMKLDSPEVQALMNKLIANNTAITSTLAVLARISATVNPPNNAAIDVLGHAAKLHYLGNHVAGYARALENDIWERAVRQEMAWEKAFHDKGGLVVTGSDTTGIGGTVAGFANHELLKLLVEAGFTPLEAIKISTLNGAISMDREDEIGTVAVGKNADLIVFDGNPDQDIAEITKVVTVFRDGIGYDSAALIEASKGRVEN